MHASDLNIGAVIFAILALCGLGYQLLVSAGILKFRRLRARYAPAWQSPSPTAVCAAQPFAVSLAHEPRTAAAASPGISILKPLRGSDPRMYEAFRSHCLQDYPEFEIIFGVAEASDPSVAEVRRLQQEFPSRDIQLIVCPETLGTNRKVSSLVQMLPAARHGLLLINDSDILVPPGYLRQLSMALARPRTGMVTALYRAAAAPTIASRLEALTIATDFAAGVLSALVLEGRLTFGLGSTLAVRREAIEAIGGLCPLLDYLADDYELGNRIAQAGYEVTLAPVVVETALPPSGFAAMFQHQLRWARTIRDRRPRGFIGLGLTYGLPWALLACAFAGGARWSMGLLLAALAVRFGVAYALCRSALDDRECARDLWLLPLREFVALLVWIVSFFGDTVHWRGETFRIHRGKLEKVG